MSLSQAVAVAGAEAVVSTPEAVSHSDDMSASGASAADAHQQVTTEAPSGPALAVVSLAALKAGDEAATTALLSSLLDFSAVVLSLEDENAGAMLRDAAYVSHELVNSRLNGPEFDTLDEERFFKIQRVHPTRLQLRVARLGDASGTGDEYSGVASRMHADPGVMHETARRILDSFEVIATTALQRLSDLFGCDLESAAAEKENPLPSDTVEDEAGATAVVIRRHCAMLDVFGYPEVPPAVAADARTRSASGAAAASIDDGEMEEISLDDASDGDGDEAENDEDNADRDLDPVDIAADTAASMASVPCPSHVDPGLITFIKDDLSGLEIFVRSAEGGDSEGYWKPVEIGPNQVVMILNRRFDSLVKALHTKMEANERANSTSWATWAAQSRLGGLLRCFLRPVAEATLEVNSEAPQARDSNDEDNGETNQIADSTDTARTTRATFKDRADRLRPCIHRVSRDPTSGFRTSCTFEVHPNARGQVLINGHVFGAATAARE